MYIDNSVSDSLSEGGSENSEGDSEYYEDNDNDFTNAAGVEMDYWTSYNPRTRRQSSHLVLPSTFQHYGSFYLRMGAVGGLNMFIL